MEEMLLHETDQEEQRSAELANEIWNQYQTGVNWLEKFGFYRKVQECYDFYEGDQWKIDGQTLQTGGERFPVENIIEPIVNYKVSSICMNKMGISLSPMFCRTEEEKQECARACELLEKMILEKWETFSMDQQLWDLTLDAAIARSAFLYFDENCRPEAVDGTNIFLGDEQERNIQEQPYIIIKERLSAELLQKVARENGIPEDEADNILPDEATDKTLGDMGKDEVKTDGDGKTTSLFKLWKGEDGFIHVCRSTKNVVYQPERVIEGLTRYPVAMLAWKTRKGSARGRGEVENLIANQIEINKNIARRLNAGKGSAYPRLVYDRNFIDDPAKLFTVGAPIEVNGGVQDIDKVIRYMSPQPISSDAKLLGDELVTRTQELANAGDAAVGSINPERASGAAIVAARDQAQIPLNFQKQGFYSFVEDVARIWYAIIVAYNPNGLEVVYEDEGGAPVTGNVSGETLAGMEVKIRVDVSSVNPFSKMAGEEALQNLFTGKAISFEEFVDALDDSSNIPKAKLMDIIEKRKTAAPAGSGGLMEAMAGIQ